MLLFSSSTLSHIKHCWPQSSWDSSYLTTYLWIFHNYASFKTYQYHFKNFRTLSQPITIVSYGKYIARFIHCLERVISIMQEWLSEVCVVFFFLKRMPYSVYFPHFYLLLFGTHYQTYVYLKSLILSSTVVRLMVAIYLIFEILRSCLLYFFN